MKVKTFKQLVSQMSIVDSQEELNELCGEIDMSFQHDKISWGDHVMLFALADKVCEGVKKC